MIRINNIRLPLDYNDGSLTKAACKELRISQNDIENVALFRRSVDARKKNDVHFLATLDVNVRANENRVLSRAKSKNASAVKKYKYSIPEHTPLKQRPLIVGFGPAGLLAGLILAEAGEKPIIIERGADCDTRIKDIESFIKTGQLNENSNIQFGEGGAGTFSDGKLNTGTKDTRARHVLNTFARFGAPKEILYDAKPHIGTDKLRNVIKNIRGQIISLGGEVLFNTTLKEIRSRDNRVTAAVVEKNGGKYMIETDNIILAIGHSSRDTLKTLCDSGIFMEQKPFSVGARIEHLRKDIDKAQYGDFADNKRLGAAPYKLNVQTSNGRGAYTFCMCPGGEVVPAASETGMVCVNGMSEHGRNAVNSNSALLVSVSPSDFGSEHPLAGIEYQREIEKKAFIHGGGGYKSPVQLVGDFLKDRKSTSLGKIEPSCRRGYEFARLDEVLPDYVIASMKEAVIKMDRLLKGFSSADAVLTGAETRSSSPVRVTRNPETLQSVSLRGLYPCGEGAGYAGGIISAAVDGIKCAEKVLTN